MPDGPDYHTLFTGMTALNGETNLKEIVQYLRFYKGEGSYQAFLLHYLPMLPKEEFDDFIGDVTDGEKAKELKARFSKGNDSSAEIKRLEKERKLELAKNAKAIAAAKKVAKKISKKK
jgi:hypothetical protein